MIESDTSWTHSSTESPQNPDFYLRYLLIKVQQATSISQRSLRPAPPGKFGSQRRVSARDDSVRPPPSCSRAREQDESTRGWKGAHYGIEYCMHIQHSMPYPARCRCVVEIGSFSFTSCLVGVSNVAELLCMFTERFANTRY